MHLLMLVWQLIRSALYGQHSSGPRMAVHIRPRRSKPIGGPASWTTLLAVLGWLPPAPAPVVCRSRAADPEELAPGERCAAFGLPPGWRGRVSERRLG